MIPADTSIKRMKLSIWDTEDQVVHKPAEEVKEELEVKPIDKLKKEIDPVKKQKLIWLLSDIVRWTLFILALIVINMLINPGKTPADIMEAIWTGIQTTILGIIGGF